MRYQPLGGKGGRRAPRRPVGLIAPGVGTLSVWSDGGGEVAHGAAECRELLAGYHDHVLFSLGSFHTIRLATGSEGWRLFKWGTSGTVVWQELDGVRVLGSRGIFTGLHPSEAIAAMLRIELVAHSYDVRIGSWSSMARQLWRATLDSPIAFAGREVGRSGFYGGRKEVRPWARDVTLTNMTHVDLKGAYPAAMWTEPIPTRMVRSTIAHIDGESIVRAEVRLPPSVWAHLPERVHRNVITWRPDRTIEGWWTGRELRTVVEMGGKVSPRETWEGHRSVEPFGKWGSIIHRLRAIPGPEGKWWKGVSNALWGTFGIAEVGGMILELGPDETIVKTSHPPGRKPPPPTAAYVASMVSARVRDRVLREALAGGWSTSAVYVDTDGVLIGEGGELPTGASDTPEPGEWSVDRIMPKVYIRGPQAWAWWDEMGNVTVSIAGVTGATLDQLKRQPIADTAITRVRGHRNGA